MKREKRNQNYFGVLKDNQKHQNDISNDDSENFTQRNQSVALNKSIDSVKTEKTIFTWIFKKILKFIGFLILALIIFISKNKLCYFVLKNCDISSFCNASYRICESDLLNSVLDHFVFNEHSNISNNIVNNYRLRKLYYERKFDDDFF